MVPRNWWIVSRTYDTIEYVTSISTQALTLLLGERDAISVFQKRKRARQLLHGLLDLLPVAQVPELHLVSMFSEVELI